MRLTGRSVQLQTRATVLGAVAVVLWSSLASLTAMVKDIPPFELVATTFGVAFLSGLTWLLISGRGIPARRDARSLSYLVFVTVALFGYHALYFTAIAVAPVAQVSLISYLWPLLIVLFSAIEGRGIRMRHVAGAMLGFTGTALVILPHEASPRAYSPHSSGLLAALVCALVWAGYSVLNRRFHSAPRDTVVIACGPVALLGWAVHLAVERYTIIPSLSQWSVIAALGIGPVGLAFIAWDYGTKYGNLGTLGTVAYAAPVLSTLLLVLLGYATGTLSLLAACCLVAGGAWLATKSRGAGVQEMPG